MREIFSRISLGTREDLVHDEPGQIGILHEKIEMTAYPPLQPLQHREVGRAKRGKYRPPHQAQLVGENAVEKLLLGSEIVVEHGMRHPGCPGYRRRLGSVESLKHELLLGGPQYLTLSIFWFHFCTNKKV